MLVSNLFCAPWRASHRGVRMAARSEYSTRNAVAAGGAVFGAIALIMVGAWQFVVGIALLIGDDFFVTDTNYLYNFNTTGWGIVHVIIGPLAVVTGLTILTGAAWARALGIFLAVLSATANFFFIPYYPFWSILLIALAVFVIWSLSNWKPAGTRNLMDE